MLDAIDFEKTDILFKHLTTKSNKEKQNKILSWADNHDLEAVPIAFDIPAPKGWISFRLILHKIFNSRQPFLTKKCFTWRRYCDNDDKNK